MNEIEAVDVRQAVIPTAPMNPMVQVATQKAIAEIQSRITLAQAKPRDWKQVKTRALQACHNSKLAEEGVWEYPKGGQNLSGPSIRLLETMARLAGNIDYGIRTLAVTEEGTYQEVYCLDLETNAKASKEIFVPHDAPRWNKDARQMQKTRLTDERDIYEHTANLGTRRLRSCMEAILPKSLLDECVQICDEVVVDEANMGDESIKRLMKAFGKLGVTPQMLDKWLGYPLAKITPRRFVRLRRIYQSIHDGYAAPSDWFRGASQARLVEERLKSPPNPTNGTGEQEIVSENGSQGDEKYSPGEQKRAEPEWKMSEAEIEDGLKQSKAIEDDPGGIDEWLDKATADLPSGASKAAVGDVT